MHLLDSTSSTGASQGLQSVCVVLYHTRMKNSRTIASSLTALQVRSGSGGLSGIVLEFCSALSSHWMWGRGAEIV